MVPKFHYLSPDIATRLRCKPGEFIRNSTILGSFAKMRKAPISLARLSVRPSVRPYVTNQLSLDAVL